MPGLPLSTSVGVLQAVSVVRRTGRLREARDDSANGYVRFERLQGSKGSLQRQNGRIRATSNTSSCDLDASFSWGIANPRKISQFLRGDAPRDDFRNSGVRDESRIWPRLQAVIGLTGRETENPNVSNNLARFACSPLPRREQNWMPTRPASSLTALRSSLLRCIWLTRRNGLCLRTPHGSLTVWPDRPSVGGGGGPPRRRGIIGSGRFKKGLIEPLPFDPAEIEPGILPLVVALNSTGLFETFSSCAGLLESVVGIATVSKPMSDVPGSPAYPKTPLRHLSTGAPRLHELPLPSGMRRSASARSTSPWTSRLSR